MHTQQVDPVRVKITTKENESEAGFEENQAGIDRRRFFLQVKA